MVKEPGEDDDDSGSAEGHKFYHNSIEHMVNEQKAKSGQSIEMAWTDEMDDMDGSFVSTSLVSGSPIAHPVERMTFEMWVSSPVNHEQALHCYTELGPEKLMPTPLEDLAGWRLFFPHLKCLVDQGKRLDKCDLVLLNASFKLMQEFPPRHSKLGISLELKFPESCLWSDHGGDTNLTKWMCTTYMYRDGVLISEPSREECHVSDHLKVRPVFQSKWWANTFTSLTEARKIAEDSHDAEAVELADQKSREFFQGLSIMQDISIVHQAGDVYQPKRDARTRMSILLWKFAQAPGDSLGITTWQSLIAPPDRVTTNSPPPSGADMDLPPLSLDSIVSPGIDSFDSSSNSQFLSQHGLQYSIYPDGMDKEICHDGYMGLESDAMYDFNHLQSSFAHGSAGVDLSLHDTFPISHDGLHASSNPQNQHKHLLTLSCPGQHTIRHQLRSI